MPKPRSLSSVQVRKIRQMADRGASTAGIAAKFEVSYSTVYQILKGITYKDVE